MTNRKYARVFLFICAALLVHQFSGSAQEPDSSWQGIDDRPIPAWFEDAKFGIFIHWGIYSAPSWAPTDGVSGEKYAEWYWQQLEGDKQVNKKFQDFHNRVYGKDFRYPYFANAFHAELFNPEKWATIIRDAGARYVILTSKHHDGFTLWPSKQSWNWNAEDIGPHRDLLGDLTKAVHAKSLKMGYYYSLYEWFNPLYKTDVSGYVDQHMIPQIKDLVNTYQPDLLWTDGEWEQTSETWKSKTILNWLFNESSVKDKIIINDRWGKGTRGKHGGYYTSEYGDTDGKPKSKAISKPWEECRGIGGSFGYNRNENLEDYSSSRQLIHLLANIVSRGGNLLLNIGPSADGSIPVIMQQRLKDIGDWLKINQESIYGTRKWDSAPEVTKTSTIFFTQKQRDVFAIATKWQKKMIAIPNLKKPSAVTMLGYPGAITYRYKDHTLYITMPNVDPENNPSQDAWVFKISDGR